MPTLGGLLWRRVSARAALASMIIGGGAALVLDFLPSLNPFEDPILIALPLSGLVLVIGTLIWPNQAGKLQP